MKLQLIRVVFQNLWHLYIQIGYFNPDLHAGFPTLHLLVSLLCTFSFLISFSPLVINHSHHRQWSTHFPYLQLKLSTNKVFIVRIMVQLWVPIGGKTMNFLLFYHGIRNSKDIDLVVQKKSIFPKGVSNLQSLLLWLWWACDWQLICVVIFHTKITQDI